MFLFIDGPALVCGWINFPILWPYTPVQTKLECPPPPGGLGIIKAEYYCKVKTSESEHKILWFSLYRVERKCRRVEGEKSVENC